jgi:hypothetical protein
VRDGPRFNVAHAKNTKNTNTNANANTTTTATTTKDLLELERQLTSAGQNEGGLDGVDSAPGSRRPSKTLDEEGLDTPFWDRKAARIMRLADTHCVNGNLTVTELQGFILESSEDKDDKWFCEWLLENKSQFFHKGGDNEGSVDIHGLRRALKKWSKHAHKEVRCSPCRWWWMVVELVSPLILTLTLILAHTQPHPHPRSDHQEVRPEESGSQR